MPHINIRCETAGAGVKGTTTLDVVRVDAEDDGSFTAVTNHWPIADDARARPCPYCESTDLRVDRYQTTCQSCGGVFVTGAQHDAKVTAAAMKAYQGMPRNLSNRSKPGEKPEWTVGNEAFYLFSDDFEVDVCLRLCGDFRDEEHRRQYAQMLARKLNFATKPEAADSPADSPGECCCAEFRADLARSRARHPGNARMFDGLLGELHELKRAYEGDGDVRAEAFDVATVAYRIATEGDAGGNTKVGCIPDWMGWGSAAPSDPALPGAEVSVYDLPGGASLERVAQRHGPARWAVRASGNVMARDGTFECEPIPSKRDDAFLERCRFESAAEAYRVWASAQA